MKNWMLNGGIYLPVKTNYLCDFPKNGVFSLITSDKNIALEYISEKFTFDYKLYDEINNDTENYIINIWNSQPYKNKNLGVIFNGIQGSGKTISAKLLCNKLNIPVILVNKYTEGFIEFIESLEFEAIVLIDEADKIFEMENSDLLLRLTEGKLNKSRKMYILITNDKDKLNENLFSRPSRIRYVKEFSGIPLKFIKVYLEENLLDKTKEKELESYITKNLKWITIDILKELVLEFNITNKLPNSLLNIPRVSNRYLTVIYDEITSSDIEIINKLLKQVPKKQLKKWMKSEVDEDFLTKNKKLLKINDVEELMLDMTSNLSIIPSCLDNITCLGDRILTIDCDEEMALGNEIGGYGTAVKMEEFGVITSSDGSLRYLVILENVESGNLIY